MQLLRFFARQERGVTSIEYALLAMLVALVIIIGASTLGTTLNDTFTTINGMLTAG